MGFKEARERKGLSQGNAAKKLRVSRAAVCQWEKGVTKPRAEKAVEAAELYECTVDELLRPSEKTT